MTLEENEYKAILKNSTKELWFAFREIGPAEAISLSRIISQSNFISKINLNGNSINDDGLIALVDSFHDDLPLVELNLAGNGITDRGAEYLAKFMAKNKTIGSLCLLGNSIGDQGAIALASMLQVNKHLQRLYLYLNSIGDIGALAIAKSLEYNSCLDTLWLDHNPLSMEGSHEVTKQLSRNKTLTTVELTINHDLLRKVDRECLRTLTIENLHVQNMRTVQARAFISMTRKLILLLGKLPVELLHKIALLDLEHFSASEKQLFLTCLFDKNSIGIIHLTKPFFGWTSKDLIRSCENYLEHKKH